jgi:M6 family metalloprotease-like protein
MDGYTLLYNSEGFLTYAFLDEEGNLQPSEIIATDIEDRDVETFFFLNTLETNLFFSDVQQQVVQQVWAIEDEYAQKYAFIEGSLCNVQYKTLCAFVQFNEKSFVHPMASFDPLFNQLGYTGSGIFGSVRDYFKETSYDQFDLIITLCGVYTAPQSESYYAGNDGTQRCQELARWAANQVAAEPGINFADYDSNGNGQVDGFHFIFAGGGKETGGCSTCIWSHKWQFAPPVTQNGKSISIYSCSPEKISQSSSSMNTIGVVCHEMSHAFGAYDFYDTSPTGNYVGTGNWDIMASGSYNGSPSGSRPPHHNTFSKVRFGWVAPIELNSSQTITDMPNSAENARAYRINTTYPNEYYLLENRQRIKFDTNVPGDGLLIYHVHAQVNQSGMQNTVNATHPQKMYPVCASRNNKMPTAGPSNYGAINSAGCPFPGTSNKTAFTDQTTPAMLSWANQNTEKPITYITHSNRLISFVFKGTTNNYIITATCDANGSISPVGETQVLEGGEQEYKITPNSFYDRETVLVNGTNNPAAVSSGSYTFTNVTSSQTIHATFAPKTYSVTFDANSGTGTMEPQTYTYNVQQKLDKNRYTKPDYHFATWNTIASGTGTSYSDEESIFITQNIKLYAQWKEGEGIDDLSNRYASLVIVPNPATESIDLRFEILDLTFENIEFFNAFGQWVKSVPYHGETQNNTTTQRISILDLSKGIYLVKAGTSMAKLVVQ